MRRLSRIVLLACLALPALSLAAYDIDLSGKVVDAAGQGVAQVEVALKGTAYKATTDASGTWVLQLQSTALLGPMLATTYFPSGEQGVYSVLGRQVGDTRQLSQGVYVQKSASSAMRSQALTKAAGEKDSLIVSYLGAEVGRLEQANLLQGALPDFLLLTVSPSLTQGASHSTLASQFRLLGQTVLVNYEYDETLWLPGFLMVGATKNTLTDPSQKQFCVMLDAKEDATVNLTLLRAQTLAVPEIAFQTYGDAAIEVGATASSGLPVEVSSTTSSVCAVRSGKVNLLAAGSCVLKASQAGNAEYHAAEIAFKAFAIMPKTLTATADDKEYDGTTAAALTLTGIVGNDDVTGSGLFAGALVGADIAVTDLVLAGAQKGNYTLGSMTALRAGIVQKTLTVAAKAGAILAKEYDGTIVNTTTLLKDVHYELTGVAGGEIVDISLMGATYNSANVAGAVTAMATFSDALTGADAGNYRIVAGSFEIPATISKATLAFTSATPGSLLLANSPVAHTFSSPMSAGFASATPSVCEYASGNLTLKAAGLCTIMATPIDVANYNAAIQSFGVDRLYDERDGALYRIVKIGTQVWMAENLAYLPSVNAEEDTSSTVGKYNVYGYNGTSVSAAKAYSANGTNYYSTYGVLYNWAAAMAGAASSVANPSGVQGVCPAGWHLPSRQEWSTLASLVGNIKTAGTFLKATSGWTSSAVTKNQDSYGFSARPGGFNFGGSFYGELDLGYWWTTSDYSGRVFYMHMSDEEANTTELLSVTPYKYLGFSVRCVLGS